MHYFIVCTLNFILTYIHTILILVKSVQQNMYKFDVCHDICLQFFILHLCLPYFSHI